MKLSKRKFRVKTWKLFLTVSFITLEIVFWGSQWKQYQMNKFVAEWKSLEYGEKSSTRSGGVNLPTVSFLHCAAERYLRIRKKYKLEGRETALIPRLATDFL